MPIEAPTSSTIERPRKRRPDRRDRRAVDGVHGAQADLRHRHQRAGIAGRDRRRRPRHASPPRSPATSTRSAAPTRKRLARLGIHLHGDVGVVDRSTTAASAGPGGERAGRSRARLPEEQETRCLGATRRATCAAPSIITGGPWSPPIASIAMRTSRVTMSARHDLSGFTPAKSLKRCQGSEGATMRPPRPYRLTDDVSRNATPGLRGIEIERKTSEIRGPVTPRSMRSVDDRVGRIDAGRHCLVR